LVTFLGHCWGIRDHLSQVMSPKKRPKVYGSENSEKLHGSKKTCIVHLNI
jgi:hypothetical protein